MTHSLRFICIFCALILFSSVIFAQETSSGWKKYDKNPVLGGDLGTCFDVTMLKDGDLYRMWFSWRPKQSIAYTESKDGANWSIPKIVLSPIDNDWGNNNWEHDLNRPGIVKKDGLYHMWYTGQADGTSKIGYATSKDGLVWERQSKTPVLVAEEPWEKVAVMCPHVEWDEQEKLFKMWYSGGEQYEPNAIGYAVSSDGLKWTKYKNNPIFAADKNSKWEQHKVTACQIVRHNDEYLMFYIGFENEHLARIGIAKSHDGITDWQRHPANPIISPSQDQWDHDACYKPFVLYDDNEKTWRLWYNGRRGGMEQIGMAFHEGEDLGFPAEGTAAVDNEAEHKKKVSILDEEQYKQYIDQFNEDDNDLIRQEISNDKAWDFLRNNIPFFDYPDKEIERTYYFRWWTFRKHLKKTESGYVITEFLPDVPWAGKANTISCAAGHHFREARWLHDPRYLNDYAHFWLCEGGAVRSYSFWIAYSMWQQYLVTGNAAPMKKLLPDLIANYAAWEKERLDPNGLFWQIDDRDGMEQSIGGSGYRATINSYMYGEAQAISRMAALVNDEETSAKFLAKAQQLREWLNTKLWDNDAKFYKVAKRVKNPSDPIQLANVREQHGFTPWYFEPLIPKPEYRIAWAQLMDPEGFYAPFGPTTAEQRHPKYTISYTGHECQWNGPSWPYSTSITLTALANLIDHEKMRDKYANVEELRKAYQETLRIYANSHRIRTDEGKTIPWIDENLNPQTGDWIARSRLKTWENGTWSPGKGGVERGKDYNHSTFCDLIINGLIGFKPLEGEKFRLFPLLPNDVEYFCLENISYHGCFVSIVYDKTGEHYGQGKGLRVYVDGKSVLVSDTLPTAPVLVNIKHTNVLPIR